MRRKFYRVDVRNSPVKVMWADEESWIFYQYLDRSTLLQSSSERLFVKQFYLNKCNDFANWYYPFIYSWPLLAFAVFVYDVKTLHAPYQHKGDLLITKDIPLSSISILFNHVLRSWMTRYRNTAQEHRSVTLFNTISIHLHSRKSRIFFNYLHRQDIDTPSYFFILHSTIFRT